VKEAGKSFIAENFPEPDDNAGVGTWNKWKANVSQAKTAIQQFEQDNASWLYQKDQATGQNLPTEQGQAFLNTVNTLRESGIKDPAMMLQVASKIHGIGAQQAGN